MANCDNSGKAVSVIIFSMLGRFLITLAGNNVFQFLFELVPTQLRGRATSTALAVGYCCNIFSPYVAYSASH